MVFVCFELCMRIVVSLHYIPACTELSKFEYGKVAMHCQKLHPSLNFLFSFHSQFSVLFNYRKHCKPLLHPTAFEHLLDTIAKLPLAVVPSDKAESDLRSELFKNLQDLWMIILKLINNHLVALDISNPGNVTILKNNLM